MYLNISHTNLKLIILSLLIYKIMFEMSFTIYIYYFSNKDRFQIIVKPLVETRGKCMVKVL